MQQRWTVFCFQVYSRNGTVILNILANWALALTFEIPSEAPSCFPSVQKFATVHFPASKMLQREAASEPVVLSPDEPGLVWISGHIFFSKPRENKHLFLSRAAYVPQLES